MAEETLPGARRGWKSMEEETDYWIPEADVIGKIPKDLHGTLLRNGPGINSVYGTQLKHPIDGDGMVCALSFVDGRVHFRSRFVSTQSRRDESRAGALIYPGQMGTRRERGIVALACDAFLTIVRGPTSQMFEYRNPSNTSVFYWGGKILTTYETYLPHCLDPYTLATLGPDDLGGKLRLGVMAAHFRFDTLQKPIKLCSFGLRPHLTRPADIHFYEFDDKWNCVSVEHSVEGLNYAHDFLLLPHYYVVHMTPFVKVTMSQAWKWKLGLSSPGEDMKYYPDLPSRFVFIPRPNHPDPRAAIISVDADPFHIFHFGTGYQQGSDVFFTAVCLGRQFNMTFDEQIALSNITIAPGRVYKFHVNLSTRTCVGLQVDSASVEFPTVNPYRHGQKSGQYSYLMANDRKNENLPYRDVVKFDFCGLQRQVWSSHGIIGEPVFAPRNTFWSSSSDDDDDGYVLVQLYDPVVHRTEFVVLDARRVNDGPIARIQLKHHIPYGFHGSFTSECFVRPLPKPGILDTAAALFLPAKL